MPIKVIPELAQATRLPPAWIASSDSSSRTIVTSYNSSVVREGPS